MWNRNHFWLWNNTEEIGKASDFPESRKQYLKMMTMEYQAMREDVNGAYSHIYLMIQLTVAFLGILVWFYSQIWIYAVQAQIA